MTELHRRLLRACFGGGIRAWQEWRAEVDIDHLDRHSQWLLPLLYRRLYSLQVEHPLMQRYKSVYLHNWYKNVLLLDSTREVVRLMGAIPCVAKRGLGSFLHDYKDVGVRPIDGAEFCIPTAHWATIRHRLAHSAIQLQPPISGCDIDGCDIDGRDMGGRDMGDYVVADGGVLEGESVVVHTKAPLTITITTQDEGVPKGWWHRLETTRFQDSPFTRLNEADTIAYMLAERTRWDAHSDLLWWADLLSFAQCLPQPSEDLLALVHPFLRE